MATYSNIGIKLITTGDESGTWGDSTNTNFSDVLDEAIAGAVTYNIASDADFTLTVSDGTSSDARHAVIKFTSTTLSATRTCTFAPNDLQKTWIVINSTTGGQSLVFKQGSSGATVTVPNGESAVIYSDGAGAVNGAIFKALDSFTNTKLTTTTLNATTVDATNLEVTNLKAKDGTSAGSIANSTGVVTIGSSVLTTTDINGGSIDGTAIGASSPSTGAFTTLSGSSLTLSSALAASQGGTGNSTYTDGQLLIGNSSGNTLTKSTLTAGSGVSISNGNGSITISATGLGGTVTSVAQSFTGGLISVAGSPITGSGTLALTVAGTSGGIPYFSSGTTWASSGALDANALVIGGGAGAAPSTTTTGTGVLTAIGNSINTTGGIVTQSGTLSSSAILLGGGSGTAITSTTTGTGVVTAIGNATNASGGLVTTDGSATLTNKTISADNNTISGVAASSFVLSDGSGNIDGSAAQKAIPSGTVVGTSDSQTLTNKRINPRVVSATTASSLTPDISAADQYAYTALAETLAINAPIGTPVDGNKLVFRILDNGVSRTLNWNGTYTSIGVTIPTSTTAGKTTYVGCIYNANNTRWDVVAVTTQG